MQFFAQWEKSLLRSPGKNTLVLLYVRYSNELLLDIEFVLQPFIYFVAHWPHRITEAMISESTFTNLVSNLKSKDERIKKDTGRLLATLLGKLEAKRSDLWLKWISDRFTSSLLSGPNNVEARVEFAAALAGISSYDDDEKALKLWDLEMITQFAKKECKLLIRGLMKKRVTNSLAFLF